MSELPELGKLYWTTHKRLKIGIISLDENGITLYRTSKPLRKLFFGSINLREEVYARLNCNDIVHITANYGFMKKNSIKLFLTKEAFENIKSKHHKIVQCFGTLLNTERVFHLYTIADHKDEIITFVDKANDIIRKQNR